MIIFPLSLSLDVEVLYTLSQYVNFEQAISSMFVLSVCLIAILFPSLSRARENVLGPLRESLTRAIITMLTRDKNKSMHARPEPNRQRQFE